MPQQFAKIQKKQQFFRFFIAFFLKICVQLSRKCVIIDAGNIEIDLDLNIKGGLILSCLT